MGYAADYRSRVFLISVNAVENGSPVGTCFHTSLGETKPFQTISQLLVQIDESLRRSAAMGKQQNLRTMLPFTAAGNDKPPQYGKLMTFSIRVLFQHNATWQGEITWLEQRQTLHFRSVLELMSMLEHTAQGGTFEALPTTGEA